jgi:hypothetical protein
MAERRCRHLVRAVRERLPEDRAEVAIVDREVLGDGVVERQVVLVVEADRVVVGWALAVVDLLRGVVHADEAVVRGEEQRAVGAAVVRLAVAPGPAVVEVGLDAVVRVVEHDGVAVVVVQVGVRAGVVAGDPGAAQPVDAGVVGGSARSPVIRRPGRVGQHAEIVIKRVVLLHDDHDVIHVRQGTVRVAEPLIAKRTAIVAATAVGSQSSTWGPPERAVPSGARRRRTTPSTALSMEISTTVCQRKKRNRSLRRRVVHSNGRVDRIARIRRCRRLLFRFFRLPRVTLGLHGRAETRRDQDLAGAASSQRRAASAVTVPIAA